MTTKRTAEERAAKRWPDSVERPAKKGNVHRRRGYATCIREEVEPLEAENAKLRALVQELVNDMRRLRIEFGNRTGTTTQIGIGSLGKCEEQGFVPTNTTEP